jgi:hypothetical protein
VSQWRQVSAGPQGALLVDDRQHVVLDVHQEASHGLVPHPAAALHQRHRLQDQHEPHDLWIDRSTRPAGVRTDEVLLKRPEVGVSDAGGVKRAKPRVHAIYDRAGRDLRSQEVTRARDAFVLRNPGVDA